MKALPKTRSGKIMRRVIRAVYLNEPLGDVSTLEDESEVEEIRRAIEQFKKAMEERGALGASGAGHGVRSPKTL